MDLDTCGYVKLGSTAAKDSVIKAQPKQSFSEEANDVNWVGEPADRAGRKDIEE